jgi:hypothetical protein
LHVQAQNFSRNTFGEDFHWATADFAIRGETVRAHAGVHDDLESLTAEGALNVLGNFHGGKLVLAAVVGKFLLGGSPKNLVFTNAPRVLAFFQMTNKTRKCESAVGSRSMPATKSFTPVASSSPSHQPPSQENSYDSFHPNRRNH